MNKILLISDANILIDLDTGEILKPVFSLDYTFATPDLLYQDELAEFHPHLLDMGLQTMELSDTSVQRVLDHIETYSHTGVSSYDLASLSLAQQEQAPLLTGDRKLHQICIQESIEVHGTIWLVEEIYKSKTATAQKIKLAYAKMKADGSRLPWDEVEKQLKRFQKNR